MVKVQFSLHGETWYLPQEGRACLFHERQLQTMGRLFPSNNCLMAISHSLHTALYDMWHRYQNDWMIYTLNIAKYILCTSSQS